MIHTTIENRLVRLFKEKKQNILNIYFTAGFPELDDTIRILKALEKSGADMVEIGMPFSDPLADGPTIQASSMKALKNGMSLKVLFNQLRHVREQVTIPILLMGYLNPVMQYGMEEFCKNAHACGVDGVILPDLPLNEYKEKYQTLFHQYHLSNVFLVTPQTSPERLKLIDELTEGFIYIVSTDSTTGGNKNIQSAEEYLHRIKNANLRNPTLVGFNIKDKSSYDFACRYANGAIIGTAFINMLSNSTDLEKDIECFIRSIRG
ncbi:MAG: tryptophan synthase subunit alpha [Cytophagaceae bacterium]|nr:tryptophan synthase subunit alpha [Cytophagaceae bacterium]MDW8457082.1 tryptophan synthase subunit alpha [Cytophagaceae bacterium]